MKRQGTVLLWAVIAHALFPCNLAGAEAVDTPRTGRLHFGWAGTSITPEAPVAVGGQYHTRISGKCTIRS